MPEMTCPGMSAIQVAHENIILIMAHCSKYFKYFLFIRGGGLPSPFSKIGKTCPNFGKNALIVAIFGLNFSFKMQYLRVFSRKNRISFPVGPFFLVL